MAVGATWTFLSTSASPATYRNSPRSVVCAGPVCHHSGRINADSWPDDTTFEAIARRLVCEKCGTRRPNVRPDWAERMPNQANWWDDKVQKGRALAEEINVLSARARAAGFQTTEYILNLAVGELWKDIEKESTDSKSGESGAPC